jgi:hypothetical protein
MPMSPEEFYAYVMRAADADGRLPLSRMTAWDVFPFEQTGLRVRPLDPPELPEPARFGEDGQDCSACAAGQEPVWSDGNWRLSVLEPTGIPLALMLEPRVHCDLPDLPDDLAAEMGLLITRICRVIESLPHIARAHVSRWGDGGAHLHIFFFARPAGFAQCAEPAWPSGTICCRRYRRTSATATSPPSAGRWPNPTGARADRAVTGQRPAR